MKVKFTKEQIQEVINNLNALTCIGINNARIVVNIVSILSQGETEEKDGE